MVNALDGRFLVLVHEVRGNDECLTFACDGYESYRKLPIAVELEGKVYAKTGWNSDRDEAYYKPVRKNAFPMLATEVKA